MGHHIPYPSTQYMAGGKRALLAELSQQAQHAAPSLAVRNHFGF